MEFSVKTIKGFAAEAATVFTRAVQYTEEKLGTCEKTELDAHFEGLAQRSDRTKQWTERIASRTEAVLQPNPNTRAEDYLFEKLDKKRDRLTNSEQLGQDMIDSGNDLGPGTAYGSALIKVGQTQLRLGQAEHEFIRAAVTNFVQPLRRFLDGDMKTIMKERKILENKRLDLDVSKNRLRKARTMESQANDSNGRESPDLVMWDCGVSMHARRLAPANMKEAEQELRIAQAEFDRQAEITRLLLEGISSAQANHLRCLNDFVESQVTYYAQCHQYMVDLQRELSSMSIATSAGNHPASFQNLYPSPSSPTAPPLDPAVAGDKKRARVLYDYDAHDSSELSLLADEVIYVTSNSGLDPDWMMGERGAQKGKVPIAYLEILN
ncbi:endophilin-B1 isoform X2 [Centruroides vittatus]|uniref:endophilin-B1 isoform X2 n=1 Tax=Centruroides vittatus TaxID=120091 RepID=UPI003510024D